MWRRRNQQDFQAEIESHLQIEIDRLMAEGATEAEARAAARRAFGNVTAVQERFYESRPWPRAEQILRDLRFAVRILRKSPGLTATAIATTAVGIGAATAVFTVVNAVLLRPLPYRQPDRLVMCMQRHTLFGPEVVTLPDYLDWRGQSTRFENLAAVWGDRKFNLTEVPEPERLTGAFVTANLFPVLGVPPRIGRTIASDAERDVVMLGYGLWRRQFGGNLDVIGRTIVLNGKPHTVIGVMPAGFSFPAGEELWAPLVPEPGMNRGYHQLWVVGRLKPDASVEQAQAELTAIAARAEREYPATNKNWGAHVATLQDHTVGSTRPALLILAGAVGCLLLLACANVAGLLMSRSLTRHHEISVRAALGASRLQIARQLLTECLLLSTCGGVTGLALAAWSIKPLLALTALPRGEEVSMDGLVLAFALAASAGTGLVFGLAPALLGSRPGLSRGLSARGGSEPSRVRPALIGLQIAVTAVLLAGAGLLIRSFHKLNQVETGFSGDRVLAVRFFLPRASYPVERCVQLYQRMTERIAGLPEVTAAAAVSSFPFSGVNANVVFEIPGRSAALGEPLTAEFRAATPGYFQTMGIPIVNGRDFAETDSANSQFVAVVNRAFADRFFGGRNPIGESVRILGPKPRMIAGVVANIRHRGRDSLPEPEIYIPHTQFPTGGMFLAVRTRLEDPLRLAGAVRAELRRLDPGLPIAQIQSWKQLADQRVSSRRFSLVLLTVFGLAAFTLSLVGTYGMVAFNISRRTKEIGIRIALGAASSEVVHRTVRAGMTPVALGLTAGVAGALGVTRVLQNMLFEIRANDPLTLAAVAMLLFCAALAACLAPARRAARIDPVIALRQDS